ncbi:hypothetical protein M432DRAFT_430850 [Thermoascus aurantiacus ATCC 26904]
MPGRGRLFGPWPSAWRFVCLCLLCFVFVVDRSTAQVFTYETAPALGGCNYHLDALETYTAESLTLVNAALDAVANAGRDITARELFSAYLGIQWDEDAYPPVPDADSEPLWETVKLRLGYVAQFLNGGGLPYPASPDKPYLFCNSTYAQPFGWFWGVFDKNGNNIPITDAEGNPTDDVWTVAQTYPQEYALAGDGNMPWWVERLKGYIFSKVDELPLNFCEKPGLFGLTPFGYDSPGDFTNNVAVFDRHVLLCPVVFNPEQYNFNYYLPTLGSTGYPDPHNPVNLDQLKPQSLTLYHELFHLVDYDYSTADPYTSLNEILAASLGTLEERQQTVNNPESYAFFSLAYWYYKNPPEGALPVTFYQGSAVYA